MPDRFPTKVALRHGRGMIRNRPSVLLQRLARGGFRLTNAVVAKATDSCDFRVREVHTPAFAKPLISGIKRQYAQILETAAVSPPSVDFARVGQSNTQGSHG